MMISLSAAAAVALSLTSSMNFNGVNAIPLSQPDSSLGIDLDYGTFVGRASAPFADTDPATLVRYHLGIPFAQPPVGDLRFKAPQPITTNYGVYDATKYSASCMQYIDPKDVFAGDAISEDCLYLNVWTPADIQPDEMLPVAVWIYGGSFLSGTTNSTLYDGANLVYEALKQGKRLIVVSANYRVNSFGFLSSPQIFKEGGLNAGLLDQKAAFAWVRKYISKFGGDPDGVTAWGHSAGAISLGFHMIAKQQPDTPALFSKAILESGGAQSGPTYNWTVHYATLFKSIATVAGCTFGDVVTELPCMRKIPAGLLLKYTLGVATKSPVRFSPVLDFVYVDENPQKKLASGNFLNVPLLTGNVANEGTVFSSVTDLQGYSTYVQNNFGAVPQQVNQTIYGLYPLANYPQTLNNDGVTSLAPFLATADIFGDYIFQCPVFQFANAYAIHSKAIDSTDGLPIVYKYKYAFQPNTGDRAKGGGFAGALGVYHGSELKYVHADLGLSEDAEQLKMMKVMSSYWISFILNGNPNLAGDSYDGPVGPVWPKYVVGKQDGTSSTASYEAGGAQPTDVMKPCTPQTGSYISHRRRDASSSSSSIAPMQRLEIQGPASEQITVEADTDRAVKCSFWDKFEMAVSSP